MEHTDRCLRTKLNGRSFYGQQLGIVDYVVSPQKGCRVDRKDLETVLGAIEDASEQKQLDQD